MRRRSRGAPLAYKTDKIDARVRADLSWRDWCRRSGCPPRRFVASASRRVTGCIWSGIARRSRTGFHVTPMTFGHRCPVSDLFGHAGRELLDRLAIPDPWRRTVNASLELIDHVDLQIASRTVEPHRRGADHRYIGQHFSAHRPAHH